MRRFNMPRHGERLLQLRGDAVHDTRTDDGIALQLYGQSFQERITLLGMDGGGCRLDSVVFGTL